jgi:hypothetical protein
LGGGAAFFDAGFQVIVSKRVSKIVSQKRAFSEAKNPPKDNGQLSHSQVAKTHIFENWLDTIFGYDFYRFLKKFVSKKCKNPAKNGIFYFEK